MNDYTRKLLDKAVDAIEAAELLLDMDKADFAAGRAYYAMFYIAEALLNERGLEFKQAWSGHWCIWKEFCQNKRT